MLRSQSRWLWGGGGGWQLPPHSWPRRDMELLLAWGTNFTSCAQCIESRCLSCLRYAPLMTAVRALGIVWKFGLSRKCILLPQGQRIQFLQSLSFVLQLVIFGLVWAQIQTLPGKSSLRFGTGKKKGASYGFRSGFGSSSTPCLISLPSGFKLGYGMAMVKWF